MQTTPKEINDFLRAKLPTLKVGTSIQSLSVIAWIHEHIEQNRTITLGLALQEGVGCSPFCGCAANQILQLLEPALKDKFQELQHFRIYGRAMLPPQEIQNQWKQS